MSARWTEEDNAVVRSLWGTIPAREIGERLTTRRSPSAIVQYARRGLALPALKVFQTRIAWTPAALATLHDLYGVVPTAELAARLGCTDEAVHAKAGKLGLDHSTQPARRADQDAATIRRLSILLAWQREQISAELAAAALGCRPQRLPALATRAAAWGARQATDTATERKEKVS